MIALQQIEVTFTFSNLILYPQSFAVTSLNLYTGKRTTLCFTCTSIHVSRVSRFLGEIEIVLLLDLLNQISRMATITTLQCIEITRTRRITKHGSTPELIVSLLSWSTPRYNICLNETENTHFCPWQCNTWPHRLCRRRRQLYQAQVQFH